jgi:hypothetical protein
MNKHTPGPWVSHTANMSVTPHIAIYAPDEEGSEIERIADVYGTPLNEANAQLIVAAPETKRQRDELLAAVESIYQHAYDEHTPIDDIKADFDRMRSLASEAIKATKAPSGLSDPDPDTDQWADEDAPKDQLDYAWNDPSAPFKSADY